MSKSSPKLNDLDDIKDHLDNTLIEFFYLFGIDPEQLKLSDFLVIRKHFLQTYQKFCVILLIWAEDLRTVPFQIIWVNLSNEV